MEVLFQSLDTTLFLLASWLLCALLAGVFVWWLEQRKYKRLDNVLKEKELELAALLARMEEQQYSQAAEKQNLQETRQLLFREFELAARKLFETGQEKLTTTGKQNLEMVLKPFREQLDTFNKRVEDIYHKENTQRNQLVGQIAALQKQAQAISTEANNLAAALKGENKTQGGWGEIILERLLEQSGLTKGREYETQNTYKNEEGKSLRPDVIVHLPDNKDIVIDAKVSLIHFEAWSNAEDKEQREKYLKAHVDSLRTHIKGLSIKNYDQIEGIRTLDFVFLFMPIETAYVLAMQHSPSLFKDAYDKNIVLVSPSSLMVALRTVETIWRYEKQNKNAEAIAESAGKLYDQFALFVESLDEVGRHISRASEAYDLSKKRLSSGKGNVLRRVEILRELGAKASKRLSIELEEETDSELEKLTQESKDKEPTTDKAEADQ